MSRPDKSPAREPETPPPIKRGTGLFSQLRPLLVGLPLLTLLSGAVFPLVLALIARPLFPAQANGSFLERDGVAVGSELIAQNVTLRRYFHPRPSAAGDGYDASASGGTNYGPANPSLRAEVRDLAETYRRTNDLPRDAVIPIDAVTRSGSGLDPHISPANAALQVARVAAARGMGEDDVRHLVAEHTQGRQFGVLGEPRVNVLTLNLALDKASHSFAR